MSLSALFIAATLAFGLVLGAPRLSTPAAAVGTELLLNPGLEEPGTGDAPAFWVGSSWGSSTHTFSWPSEAHSGAHSVRVDVSSYVSGDSKWAPDEDSLASVTGGTHYTFSDWYRSDATTAVSVYYETADDDPGEGTWANLFSGIAPASSWTQYTTAFTMPAGAVRAYFAHFIARNGFLQTDDYSMQEADPPAGFGRPMISLSFDDGSAAFHQRALPRLDAKGFVTTQYIPTAGLVPHTDPFLMTGAQIRELALAGHEIGSHSVGHPDLTQTTDAVLAAELEDSRATLESITGPGSVVDLAYPFGSYDARVIAAAKVAGYRSARSVEEGYNAEPDLEPFDIRGQNILRTTTLATFKSWVDYAKAHDYWLVLIYHEVVPDSAPVCTDPQTVDPCLGSYDTTTSAFQQQLDYLVDAGVGPDVMTVKRALDLIGAAAQPTAGTVQISPDDPTTDATVAAIVAGFSDPDGDELAYTYRWLVDDVAVDGATGASLDLATAGHGDRGDVVRVDVTADDGDGHTSATVSANVTVANSPPTIGQVDIGPSNPVAGTTLTATPTGFGDADGDPLTYHHTWQRNDVALDGETSATLAAAGAAGDVVRADVRADDGQGGTSGWANAAVTLAAAPVTTPTTPTTPIAPTTTTPPTTTTAPVPAADTTPPRIAVVSPTPRSYRRGWKVTMLFSCRDSSGVAQCRATIRRNAGRAISVRPGVRVLLARTGRYVLRIRAADRLGNSGSRTIRFRVVRE